MVGFAGPVLANSDEEQLARMNDPDQWPAPGRDFALTRHSPLSDIHKGTVDKLNLIWLQSTGALRGHEGQPLVVKDVGEQHKTVLFMISGCPTPANCNVVQALDLTADPDYPKEIWNYVRERTSIDEAALAGVSRVSVACCDTVNRGGSYADGKFVFGTLDGYLIALDAQTGKEKWVVKHASPEKGETITPAPLIADDKVIIGFGGDEFAARGRVTAYKLSDGSKVWECYSTGSDREVCLTSDTNRAHPEYGQAGSDLGINTFPGEEWKRGGGAAWGWYSYDPALKLVYYSTGNPGLWSPSYRCGATPPTHEECNNGKWDNKWSMTIFARKVENGDAVWAYQMTPFDQWDYDGINEDMLTDMNVDGTMRKTLTHFDRNGFAYVLDRTDGTLLRANKYVTVDWAEKVDPTTKRPIKVREHSPLEIGRNVESCPSAMGGKDQQPCAVDPEEPEKVYCPTNNWCMELDPQERTHTNQGTVYVFANVYMFPETPGTTGKLKKFDVLTGTTEAGAGWQIKDPYPNWGGVLVTGKPNNGLVFYGSLSGEFRAVDRRTGDILWRRKLGSSIIGNAITWKVGGKQYVGVYSGIGGWIGLPITAGLDLNDRFCALGACPLAKATGLQLIPQGGHLNVFRITP
jgi:lanthanide-dependent methanol dehydrogenase